MTAENDLDRLRQAQSDWEANTLRSTLARAPERQAEFITTSSAPVERLYTPLDLPDFDYLKDLGFPGEYPYTRGVHATGHRGKLWTMRQFAGFGSAEESNARYKYLLEQGSAGLSILNFAHLSRSTKYITAHSSAGMRACCVVGEARSSSLAVQ